MRAIISFLMFLFPLTGISQISILNVKADSTGATSVCVKTTSSARVYFEVYRWNKWLKLDSASIRREADTCITKSLLLHSGRNDLRVRAIDSDGNAVNSTRIQINNGPETKRCTFAKVCGPSDSLQLTTITMWEIYDSQGVKIRSGVSDKIPLLGLSKGGYFLNYDNKTAEFFVGD